jgi:molybdenum-dependent DNA-binding transcriptional regulator ModE
MELMKMLLETTEITKAQASKIKEVLDQKAVLHAENQKRLAVLKAITSTLEAEQSDLEAGMIDMMRQLNQADAILNGVTVSFKEGGVNAGRTSYQKVCEELLAELKKFDKEADKIYTRLVEKFRGEGSAKKPVLKVVTDTLSSFFDLVVQTPTADLMKRIGSLEKYPELIKKEKARTSKVGGKADKAVNEGVADDAKKVLSAFRDSIARAVKALMPRAEALVASAERIKQLAASIK